MNMKNNRKYDDIIHLPHHVSTRHPQMSPLERAAQFSPFAALTGHGDAILETARQTDSQMELNEDQKEYLNRQLIMLKENLSHQPEITVTYFQPDEKKTGGSYRTMRGRVQNIDTYQRQILFCDKTALAIESIISMEGGLFENLFS